jgi:hypothetical protein
MCATFNDQRSLSQDEITLEGLARRIRDGLVAARKDRCNALHHDLAVGDALNAAQSCVSTGWKRWLREHCFLSVRTAMLYQQLARHRAEIEAEIERVGELSLRAAMRLITKPSPRGDRSPPKPALNSAAWARATPEERRRFLEAIGLLPLLSALPPAWRNEIEQRARRKSAATSSKLNDTLTKALRTALSLQLGARKDELAVGIANALNGILNKLQAEGLELHDIEIIAAVAMKRAA